MITVDNTSNLISTGYNATTTWSWTHTTASGATLLIISASIWLDIAPAGIITGITYNGVPMTKAVSHIATGTNMDAEIWYLENPASGANTVQVTLNGATDCRKFGGVSLFGTASSPLDQNNNSEGYGVAASTSVTTGENNEYVIDSLISYGGTVPNCNQTPFLSNTTGSTLGGGSYIEKAGAGSQAMAWSWTTNGDYSHVVASFKAGATTSVALSQKPRITQIRPRLFSPQIAK